MVEGVLDDLQRLLDGKPRVVLPVRLAREPSTPEESVSTVKPRGKRGRQTALGWPQLETVRTLIVSPPM
jgi:hypothetical protein